LARPLLLVAVSVLAVSLTGCPATDGSFDLSGVPPGSLSQPYTGQIRVLDYDDVVRFDHVGGELPDGLEIDLAGAITGTPTVVGRSEITILATGMKRIEEFQAPVAIDVAPPEGAFLGFDHTQLGNLSNVVEQGPDGLMRDVWVRVDEGGEPDQQTFTIDTGLYLPGLNLLAEDGMDDGGIAGRFDDVRIADVPFGELELEFTSWEATEEEWYDPGSSYPSPHLPEGDPPSINSSGTVTAGVDAGGAALKMTHPVYGELTTRILVVPPDWCPQGTDFLCEPE
jgi:hypothetical protein